MQFELDVPPSGIACSIGLVNNCHHKFSSFHEAHLLIEGKDDGFICFIADRKITRVGVFSDLNLLLQPRDLVITAFDRELQELDLASKLFQFVLTLLDMPLSVFQSAKRRTLHPQLLTNPELSTIANRAQGIHTCNSF